MKNTVDVVTLRRFYHTSSGIALRTRLLPMLRQMLHSSPPHDLLVGVGYAPAYLRRLQPEPNVKEKTGKTTSFTTSLALMPAEQGAIYWPVESDNRACLIAIENWPLRDHALNQLLIVHALEHTDYPGDLLREAWRVLSPGGKLVLIAPLKNGLWQRIGATPLRAGKASSLFELQNALQEVGFTITKQEFAASVPPCPRNWLNKSWQWLDRACCFLAPFTASLAVIEVEKQIYASVGKPAKRQTMRATSVPQTVRAKI